MIRTQSTGTLDQTGRRPGRVGLLIDGYQRRASFEATEDVTRTKFAVEFVSKCRTFADRVIEERDLGAPEYWNDYQRPWASKRRLSEYRAQREAWGEALDLLFVFSQGEFVDADALREALTRKSLRAYEQSRDAKRHSRHWFAASARESAFSKASSMVYGRSPIDAYSERELDLLRNEYHRGRDFDGE